MCIDDWEHRKLGEVAEIVAGGDIDKSKLLDNGEYPVIANVLTSGGIMKMIIKLKHLL